MIAHSPSAFWRCSLWVLGLFLCVGEGGPSLYAQLRPTHADVGVEAVGTTGETTPFWLHANTGGRVGMQSSAGRLHARVAREMASGRRWDVGYGAEVMGRLSARETLFFPTLYAEARYGFLRLRVGRKEETLGLAAPALGSGSLGQSRNATPVPKVVLATDGYTAVPFTRRWIEFRGRYADGRLPDGRVVEGGYLHQKTLYLRVGRPAPVQVVGGLVHNALWGGTAPSVGSLPQSLNDYGRTIVALGGAEDAPSGERAYIQGNHLGVIDVGAAVDLGRFRARAYRQFIYEDRDNLKFKSPQDGLLGVVFADTRPDRWLDRVVYEHLYTKWQNGPVAPGTTERGGAGGRDNYYNHYIYGSGWTHYGRSAGSPLLTPAASGAGFANNRVVGHHLGFAGHLAGGEYRLLATYTRNYGTYDGREAALEQTGTYRFQPPLEQVSLALEGRRAWPGRPALHVQAGIGVDVGELYEETVAARIGLSYHIRRLEH
jgi:hypothetical protein